jgi:hypothetical protein
MSVPSASSPGASEGETRGANDDVKHDIASRLAPTASRVAVALVLIYLVAVFLLWKQASSQDLLWTRRLYLLGGLEALAFAGAGALFGVAVQRPKIAEEQQLRAEAEKRANEAEERSAVLEPKANLGGALEAVVRARAERAGAGSTAPQRYAGAASSAPGDMHELLSIIEHYHGT